MSNEEPKPDILSRITQTITYKDYVTNKEVCNMIHDGRSPYHIEEARTKMVRL